MHIHTHIYTYLPTYIHLHTYTLIHVPTSNSSTASPWIVRTRSTYQLRKSQHGHQVESLEKSDASGLKRIRDWENERRVCNGEAKEQRKRLKLTSSFDAAYWTARRDIADKEIQATLLTKQISIASMKNKTKDNTKDFVESEAGQRLMLQEKSLKLDSKLFHAQAEKMGSKEETSDLRRSFIQLFVGAETGLGIKNSSGQRDNSLQSASRSELILKTGSEHPISDYDQLWCPIHRNYLQKPFVIAGHLFLWKCGEDTMQSIFGLR